MQEKERKKVSRTARIEWQDEYIEIDDTDNPDIGQLESAMRFKAQHIKAKADPQLFECVADALNNLCECIFKGAYLKRGHWDSENYSLVCSGCNKETPFAYESDFCPNCGAKMDKAVSEMERTS